MRISQLKDYIVKLYTTTSERIPLLILGEGGIGKTTVVREAAQEIAKLKGKEFIEYTDEHAEKILANPERYFVLTSFILSESEPSDFLGLPREQGDVVKYKPLIWVKVMNKCDGILLIDEFTNEVRSDLMSACYKIVDERKAGFTKFSDGVMVICTGNTPESSSLATELPAPMLTRAIILKPSPPSVDDWANWMNNKYGNAWDKRVYGFMKAFEKTDPSVVNTSKLQLGTDAYPCRRSQTKIARLLHLGFNDQDTIIGAIGQNAGAKLKAFLELTVDIDDLIERPESFKTLKEDAKFLATTMIANKILESKTMQPFVKLIDVMATDSLEFLMMIRTILPHNKKRAFMEMIEKHLPHLKESFIEVLWDFS